VEEFVEGKGFERSLGVEFLEEGLLEFGEDLVFVVADDEVPGGEAVADGVLGRAPLPSGVRGPVESWALA
jgi:hypothetical protein